MKIEISVPEVVTIFKEAVEKLGIAGTRMFFVDKSESLRQVMLGRANPALEDKWKRIFTRVI
jgi:hypothetical protein